MPVLVIQKPLLVLRQWSERPNPRRLVRDVGLVVARRSPRRQAVEVVRVIREEEPPKPTTKLGAPALTGSSFKWRSMSAASSDADA
jgi:hypothetical protein